MFVVIIDNVEPVEPALAIILVRIDAVGDKTDSARGTRTGCAVGTCCPAALVATSSLRGSPQVPDVTQTALRPSAPSARTKTVAPAIISAATVRGKLPRIGKVSRTAESALPPPCSIVNTQPLTAPQGYLPRKRAVETPRTNPRSAEKSRERA